MAASFSCSSSRITSITPIQQKYDVFISFRGTDTRDSITSHVYAALCSAKIQTFIDNDLRRGDDVSDSLLRRIEESKISLIIFSEDYASSRWCLDELLKIMECCNENGQIVIPVFFKVDPSHVRKQSGPFGQALAQYEGHPKIQRWKDALTKAANLSGWDSRVTRPEATLVKSIVKDILGKLYYTSSNNFGDLVGMSSHFEQIESLLSMIHEEVRIIGLWGMGGIGKTTLARAFFNHNLSKFEGHCIIEDIRETCEKRGLNELREKLVTGLLLLKDENLNIGTPNLGIPFIRNILRRKKVLIVLDDVNDFQHIELLVGRRDCVGPGSIIMITSRDKQVLKNGVDRIYEVPGLDYSESLCLFSRYAFKQEHLGDGDHVRLSNRAISYAKGHPLALKILGSHLFGRSKQEQESALRKLERTPNMAVQQVLLISYHGLDHEEKNLFLNIACLFKGEYVEEIKCFHDSNSYYCYSTDIGLGVLIDKSLITVSTGRVWMHDLVQEMGRQIVREESIEEPGKRSRLWDHADIYHVLTKNTGTEAVKGILLDRFTIRHLSINPVAFERMHNLEFLKIRVSSSALCLPHGLESLSNKLRYMYWQQYPLTYMPSNFQPENLVKLVMPNSHVERLWNGRQNLVHLKEIDLSYSKKLIEIPDLSLATDLQELVLRFCDRLENLQVRNISNLKSLNLGGCSLINKFPEVSLEIQQLYLDGTAIEEVPSTVCNLKSLVVLDLGGCRRLKNLPSSIYKLKLLREIGMYLPSNKQGGANIHLKELTDQLVWLSSVERLNLSGNNFQKIPVAIKELSNLIHLSVEDCRKLQSLPQLPMNVQFIYAANCKSLEMVASPLSATARGVFDSYKDQDDIVFHFPNCSKLDEDARNSIVADVESKLLHWKATYPEQNTGAANIMFPGGDIPDWFNYKGRGCSLTVKLPPRWCNSELFCLVFSIALEFRDFPKYCSLYFFNYNCHIKTNRGDSFSASGGSEFVWRPEDPVQSNQVFLGYNQSLVNDWRRMSKEEADDEEEISIEFFVKEDAVNYCTVEKCGLHLLYSHDIENRYCRSVVQANSPYGELTQFMDDVEITQFTLKQDCVDDVEESVITQLSLKQDGVKDVEESVIEDAKGTGGYSDSSCSVGNPVEELAPVLRRRKKMKWKLNTFKFTKFLGVRRKSTRKVWRN